MVRSRYAGETSLLNGVDLELHSAVTSDNNVFGLNTHKQGDVLFQEGASFSLLTRRQAWDLWLQYRPDYVFYKSASSINQFTHGFDFDTDYRVTRHVTVRLKDSLAYESGVMLPRLNADFALPVGLPATLNTTIFTPTARAFSNQAGFDTTIQFSRRSSFDLTTAYAFRRLSHLGPTVANFFNTRGVSGGFGFQYRANERLTIGPRFLYQDYRFGSVARDQTQSVFLNVLWDMGPSLSISAFGGPQYSNANGQFLRRSTDPTQPPYVFVPGGHKGWNMAGGASVSLRAEKTLLRFSAQRIVSDGGGLLTAVTNTSEAVELRRRLTRYWDIVLTGSNARSLSLPGAFGRGQVDAQSFGVALERPIKENLSVHGEFNFLRQRTNQIVPFEANMNRNRVMIGLFYRIGTYKLGQ
ncbi:MAG TPA: hypothetical protein VOA41_19330 [Candidatus Dormibacteraeota bacterium]|nr:hypothetical protein [Candidatus Dormibacteraeota bacterium]